MVKANKRAQKYYAVTFKFGVRLPRNYKEAFRLDQENSNEYWKEAIDAELGQLDQYKTFKDLGKRGRVPEGYQMIPIRIVLT